MRKEEVPLLSDDLKALLLEKADRYNRLNFIERDPISIPHAFQKKEDIEIAGFLAATIAWGQRKTLIRNAQMLMDAMDRDPYQFILHHAARERQRFAKFVHRTFSGNDCMAFMESLQNVYRNHGGLEAAFQAEDGRSAILKFRALFLPKDAPVSMGRHVANPAAGSAAKRLNMYLRWMVRNDQRGVDFGIWAQPSMSKLFIPLDVHSGGVARNLGILLRKQDDWQAVELLTEALIQVKPEDPVLLDYALFGMGVNEKRSKPNAQW